MAVDDKSSLKLKDVEQREHLSYVDHAMLRTTATLKWGAGTARQSFDSVSPIKSDEIRERWQTFASANPKLAAFILINLVFSGVPILLFTLFSISVLVFSLVTGIILGIVGALVLTSSIVGFGLLFIIPTVILTTVAATTLFFWGFVALWLYAQYERRQ